MQAELAYRSTDGTGEGAIWLPGPGLFLWLDIEGELLHRLDTANGVVTDYPLPGMGSSIIPLGDPEDSRVILTVENRLVYFDPLSGECSGGVPFPGITEDYRFNDAKASPEGRIWAGVMHRSNHRETGTLGCIERDYSFRPVLLRQSIPNGIVWNAAGDRMYYADSGKGCIYEFEYDPVTGDTGPSRIAVRVPEDRGIPDGMAIDRTGNLWVAHWGGSGVYVWNPATGKSEEKIELPVPNPASCTFGGESMNNLYITTARSGLSQAEIERFPLSGSLFAVEVPENIAGKNHYPFLPE